MYFQLVALSILILICSVCESQKLIPLNGLKGENGNYRIDATPPYALFVSAFSDENSILGQIYVRTDDGRATTLESLKNNTPFPGLSPLEPYRINSTAYISSNQSNEVLAGLTGFLYITTEKQMNDEYFYVYDVDQYQKIQISRLVLWNSTIVILNSNQDTVPAKSSLISGWLQTQESSVTMFKGIPTDDEELPNSHFFSNPVHLMGDQLTFIPKVEKFSVSLPIFYLRTYMDITFHVEPGRMDLNGYETTSYTSTGLFMKSQSEKAQSTTIVCLSAPLYNGTTGANIVGSLPSMNGKVTVQERSHGTINAISVFPATQTQEWMIPTIGDNITISSNDSDEGEFFVQYYIIVDRQNTVTGQPDSSPTSSYSASLSIETTTKSSPSYQLRLLISIVILASAGNELVFL